MLRNNNYSAVYCSSHKTYVDSLDQLAINHLLALTIDDVVTLFEKDNRFGPLLHRLSSLLRTAFFTGGL